jgi:hypothetical protein
MTTIEFAEFTSLKKCTKLLLIEHIRQSKKNQQIFQPPPKDSLFFISEHVAVKIINKSRLDSKTQKMVQREMNIMDSLSHPNLIRYNL